MALYAFDGTWQAEDTSTHPTNISLFKQAYADTVFYYPGIGTRGGKVLRLVAGSTGLGGQRRVWDAEDDLATQIESDDKTIDIIGFSRGAALALEFANEIAERTKPQALTIRFLGLFDTVHAFGLASVDSNIIHDPNLPDNVSHCYHALAIDERRGAFNPTRVPGNEVWFRGVHSDIGGGNGNTGLNAIPLHWMLCKASAAGLPIKSGALTQARQGADAAAEIRPAKFDPVADPHRVITGNEKVHYSVATRPDHNNAPGSAAVENIDDESRL